jgi:hypothetical protein
MRLLRRALDKITAATSSSYALIRSPKEPRPMTHRTEPMAGERQRAPLPAATSPLMLKMGVRHFCGVETALLCLIWPEKH